MSRVAIPLLVALGLWPSPEAYVPSAGVVATVRNPAAIARIGETTVLAADELRRLLAVDDVRRVHVLDTASGQELLTQAIDLDDDGSFDQVVFQLDLGPNESRRLVLRVGRMRIPRREDFRAYGRFVRERRDDFAWENDLVAHRMYGAALETWAQEPLTSSAVDVWCKRTRRLVINDWYMIDDYHHDDGEGGDFYSAGRSRGCGGNGLWAGGKLYPSANFRGSRVIANGPVRVEFELVYAPWSVGEVRVSETKRITLDAGAHLNRFESRYVIEGARGGLAHAAGIKASPGAERTIDRTRGILRTWEPIKGELGNLGCAVLADPAQLVDSLEADGNHLVITRLPDDAAVVYWAGSAWDQGGDISGVADWDRYLDNAVLRLRAPLEVRLEQAEPGA
jgi:unsaturated rhamnogalacturonyl hydrolase